MDRRLRQAAPDFEDWREALALTESAEITLRAIGRPGEAVSLSQRDRLAGILARGTSEDRAAIRDAFETYREGLDAQSLGDTDLAKNTHQTWKTGWARFLLGILLLPYAVVGFLLNLVPFLIVKAVGLVRMAPAAMASLKPIAAILAFGVTWGLAAWAVLERFGLVWAAASLLVMPLYGVTTVLLWERVVLGLRFASTQRTRTVRMSSLETLRENRRSVISSVLGST
jgi:hypothetical protein